MPGFQGWLETAAGRVARIATTLTLADHIGACKVRWGINRMHYLVPAGLYAVGTPGPDAPVLVTANYKMSYDLVRRSLSGRNVWLLVLETFGINVWCAAGKGSFGTDELVNRIVTTRLARVTTVRRLVLPILGAPGVAAHEVARRTGFAVSYATLRAADLPAYLDNGMIPTRSMRELRFSLYDRLVLVPVEVVLASKWMAAVGGALFISALLAVGVSAAVTALAAYVGALLTGVVAVPVLLPLLPGRSFALKGGCAGLIFALCFYLAAHGESWSRWVACAAFLALPAVASFYALNFTGCTPYTSRSGVKKEMRLSLPVMGIAVACAILLLVAGRIWS